MFKTGWVLRLQSKAEWSTVVKHELTHIQRRTLAGLYDTVNGCDLSVLGCQGLEEMLKPLTTEVMNGSSRRYLSNHFSRAGLAVSKPCCQYTIRPAEVSCMN